MTKYTITMSSPDDERKVKHTELVLLDGTEAAKTVGLSWDNFRFTSTDPIFSSAKEFFKMLSRNEDIVVKDIDGVVSLLETTHTEMILM